MRQTEYRRRNTALTEEIFEELQEVSQAELNWLFRQIRYKVRRLDRQRMKVVTGSPRLQKSYVVSGNLWDLFLQRMRSALTRAIVRGAIKLATLQRNHFASFKPVEFDPEEFAKFIEPEIGERIVGVEKNIKRLVGAKVVGWYNSPGTSMQSLVDQLKPIFGEKRARLIAQTEVTRLNSEVKRLTAEQIGATEWWWSTRRDNLVCVKPMRGPDGKVYNGCRELHGKTFDIGLPMPPDGSHPGCRCDPVIVPPSTAARARTAKPVIEGLMMQKFDPNQPRDKDGKWTDTGKGGGSTSGYKVRNGGFEFIGWNYKGTPEEFREEHKNEHLYHATNKSNLDSIKKEGLVSGKPTNFEGYKTPEVALSTTTATADYFASLMEASYKDKGRDFEPVLLRVKVSDTDAKPYKWHVDEVRSSNIPPEKLEIWNGDEWEPLVGDNRSKAEERVEDVEDKVEDENTEPNKKPRFVVPDEAWYVLSPDDKYFKEKLGREATQKWADDIASRGWDVEEVIKESRAHGQYPQFDKRDYSPDWGTQAEVEYTVWRAGNIEVNPRGTYFGPTKDEVESYLEDDRTVKSYKIKLHNPKVYKNKSEAIMELLPKYWTPATKKEYHRNYGWDNEGEYIHSFLLNRAKDKVATNRRIDEELYSACRKRGIDAMVLLSPEPPCTREIMLVDPSKNLVENG